MPETPAKIKTRIRDAVAAVAGSLDPAVTTVEAALAELWRLERSGYLGSREVPNLLDNIETTLRKIAPPPPKKIKFSDPLRKIIPLSPESVKPAVDAAVFLMAFAQVGDFTETTDKKQLARLLFLDDWRRMIWESARIPDWKRFRELAPQGERVLDGRLSRESALQILEALHKRRVDNITPIPDVSILACARCGTFRGSDRVRCLQCKGTYCTKCLSPMIELCLVDYTERYVPIDPARREKLTAEARAVCREFRLDAYARNDAFARALREKGVDLVFVDHAPPEGTETAASQGRLRLEVRERENASTRRILFAALARAIARDWSEEEPGLDDLQT
ncbi:MAG TPA: hypothetical protein VEJ18_10435, partial [Planctomycetota bacterium]|nr:hypothetical protein [Planctomycetota bacterium]